MSDLKSMTTAELETEWARRKEKSWYIVSDIQDITTEFGKNSDSGGREWIDNELALRVKSTAYEATVQDSGRVVFKCGLREGGPTQIHTFISGEWVTYIREAATRAENKRHERYDRQKRAQLLRAMSHENEWPELFDKEDDPDELPF